MRMSSEMFPFASHGKYGYSLDYCADLLKEVGDLAKSLGHRLTTHPGQFNQLGSPKPEVVESSIRDLEYHAQMMDLMGLGPDSVMIIHASDSEMITSN
jgi:UV DNA damage endonuclease